MWTCGVDRFSQCVRKFESKALLLQTSVLSWNFLSSQAEENSLPCRTSTVPELIADWTGRGVDISETPGRFC